MFGVVGHRCLDVTVSGFNKQYSQLTDIGVKNKGNVFKVDALNFATGL